MSKQKKQYVAILLNSKNIVSQEFLPIKKEAPSIRVPVIYSIPLLTNESGTLLEHQTIGNVKFNLVSKVEKFGITILYYKIDAESELKAKKKLEKIQAKTKMEAACKNIEE